MPENHGPRPVTAPGAHPNTPAQSNPLDAGSLQAPPVLMSQKVYPLFLEGKDTGDGIWEFPSMMVGRLRIAVDGFNHDVGFVSIRGAAQPTYFESDEREIAPGSELHAWLEEQVQRLWSALTS
jgi:hypothetical protein